MTTLSVIIPTQGRDTLERTLRSCLDAGLRPDDEILVVADTHEPLIGNIIEMMSRAMRSMDLYIPNNFLVTHDAGHHCFGHCQINHGLEIARGDYIVLNDDDDVFASGAFDRIRAAADELPEPRPLLFRFQSMFGVVYWLEPHAGTAYEGQIGGHCAVFPNDKRLGRFSCRYNGDYDYIRSTLDNWGGDSEAVWIDDVIAIARPPVEVLV